MANINLYQSDQPQKTTQAKMLDSGLLLGFIIFLAILAAFGGMKFYLYSLDQKIKASKNEEISGKNLLKGSDVDFVASFQQRMDILEAEKEAFVKNDPAKLFLELQKTMVGGAVATEVKLQDQKLSVLFLADDFEVLAKQILSFKNDSVAFQDVEVKSSVREEGGKVKAEVSMGLIFN